MDGEQQIRAICYFRDLLNGNGKSVRMFSIKQEMSLYAWDYGARKSSAKWNLLKLNGFIKAADGCDPSKEIHELRKGSWFKESRKFWNMKRTEYESLKRRRALPLDGALGSLSISIEDS